MSFPSDTDSVVSSVESPAAKDADADDAVVGVAADGDKLELGIIVLLLSMLPLDADGESDNIQVFRCRDFDSLEVAVLVVAVVVETNLFLPQTSSPSFVFCLCGLRGRRPEYPSLCVEDILDLVVDD